jgi:hypothetical protein
MIDLSHLARNGPWVTSQAGGNMTSSNMEALTAPGSPPSDPLPDRTSQGDPVVSASDTVPVGTPPSRITTGGYAPSPPVWQAD